MIRRMPNPPSHPVSGKRRFADLCLPSTSLYTTGKQAFAIESSLFRLPTASGPPNAHTGSALSMTGATDATLATERTESGGRGHARLYL